MSGDVWEVGDAYEAYVGRWSRKIAVEFVRWLGLPSGLRWLDAGCGTGALTSAVLASESAAPTSPTDSAHVVGVDPSLGFLRSVPAPAGRVAGDAAALPLRDESFDVVVSGLALNFVPRPEAAVAEFARVAAPGAVVASYVWDYAEGMRMMRHFWDVAAEVVPAAAEHDEGPRFPICHEPALRAAWAAAGLAEVSTRAIEVPTVFRGFDDFWLPFLGGQGAAPAYLATLGEDERAAIRERLHARLGDGEIALTASAWAVRGRRPTADEAGLTLSDVRPADDDPATLVRRRRPTMSEAITDPGADDEDSAEAARTRRPAVGAA
ncbi:methyltransferase domain-containing protein [Actinoplanes bogorensis]|uniref:Methyltransferase domain-containing protein n=1 Tax=Paractinoplanes bogorensis TaxID=1610840 RepID=A0ABS5YGP2_9ACTN|nr:methyltransferase domain-containing protein [Actinoplanes bogorensis]MBU2662576.1 methyltransferase domain-containing protein [Actinoplanes bogorensis]